MNTLNNIKWSVLPVFVFALLFAGCTDPNMDDFSKNANNKLFFHSLENEAFSPYNAAVLDGCFETCLIAGQHTVAGNMQVMHDKEYLYVTYNVTQEGVYLKEVHLDLFNDDNDFTDVPHKNGNPIPGKFEYKMEWEDGDMQTSHTVKINRSDAGLDEIDCINIAAHAALSNGETAWGGVCEDPQSFDFPGKNWATYFKYCFPVCTVDFTYAWEDINRDNQNGNLRNDADFNDLVIQANQEIIKNAESSTLKLKFTAIARGANYNHAFKVNIPITGDYSLDGGNTIQNASGTLTLMVFNNTKADIPANNQGRYEFGANTWDVNCLETNTKEFEIIVYGELGKYTNGLRASVLDPFITVKSVRPNYDLHIWEITGNDSDDTFQFIDLKGVYPEGEGKHFPNGIIIPEDWQWPVETQNIWGPYNSFSDIDSWDTNWYLGGASDTDLVFDKTIYDECDYR
ncbi:LruC domain-containing protein [Marivirga sp.]|uniref:LruC domain-containing protein n=1 Tax=Marivirga sp. TaxID=2018662 RepID=UPI0025CE3C22|nr:LruC domain-containing protein [Marivirga sp.]